MIRYLTIAALAPFCAPGCDDPTPPPPPPPVEVECGPLTDLAPPQVLSECVRRKPGSTNQDRPGALGAWVLDRHGRIYGWVEHEDLEGPVFKVRRCQPPDENGVRQCGRRFD
jgi:hypothetical protein